MARARHMLQLLMPPALWTAGQALRRQFDASVDDMAFAPLGWETPLPAGHVETFWTAFLEEQQQAYAHIYERVVSGDSLLSPRPEEDEKYVVFGYALALAAARSPHLSLLDYGGNLGEYLWIAKAMVPAAQLKFHCREHPAIAAVGRRLNPSATWHVDDDCLRDSYDLVMFMSSLQCLPHWRDTVTAAATAARHFLLLADVPIVSRASSFVSTFRSRSVTTLYNHINRGELVGAVESAGLRLVREFEMGPHVAVRLAPEQPCCRGFLFQRASGSGTGTSGA